MLGSGDEVGGQPRWFAGRLDVGEAAQDLAEDGLNLHARDVGAQAEVRASATEGDVVVRRTTDVETRGVGKSVLITVGRAVVHDDLVACFDLLAPELDVAGGAAPHVD